MSDATRADYCVIACAEAWRGDGEVLASPIGVVPTIAARVARATFEPDLVLTDGEALIISNTVRIGASDEEKVVEGWMPFRLVFDTLWAGRRHVMMGATQIDRFGNQNIACIGEWDRPKAQLLGVRGAPGNTVNHPTSYWVPNHSLRSFPERVDFASGVGYDRAKAGPTWLRGLHEIRRVVTNLAVLDFETQDNSMRLRSVHPGVKVEDVLQATSFPLAIGEDLELTRDPTADELRLIREVIDPEGQRLAEVRA